MSGSYSETLGKDEEDDSGNTFLPTKWTKMSALFGTVHWLYIKGSYQI